MQGTRLSYEVEIQNNNARGSNSAHYRKRDLTSLSGLCGILRKLRYREIKEKMTDRADIKITG
jgi:hypothetical protein